MTIQRKMISKYALLLSLFFVAEFVFDKYLLEAITPAVTTRRSQALYNFYPYVFSFLLNVTTAVMVNADIKKLDLSTRYVILAILLYQPVGVCAFLLFVTGDKELKTVPY